MNLRDSGTTTALGLVAAVLLIAAPSAASNIHIGGIDLESQYTGAGATGDNSGQAGILTFDDALNGMNDPEFGVVDSEDLAGFDLIGLEVRFEAVLSATGKDGLPFNPATDNLKKARFVGTGGSEFLILDPDDNYTVILAFDLSYIDVSPATYFADPANLDPDGGIVMGDLAPDATSSLLTVSGGTLAAAVGGIGTRAVLQIEMATIDPKILAKADFTGYLNTNFTSGVGFAPVSKLNWDLTIIPEPSTAVLLGFSLLGVLAAARRRAPR